MSDLANKLKMLANSISGVTTESVGNSGGSNPAVSNEEVSVFERKTNENVDLTILVWTMKTSFGGKKG